METKPNCIDTGCLASPGNWPEGCVCYHAGQCDIPVFWQWVALMTAVAVIVAGFVFMAVNPVHSHPVAVAPAAAPAIGKAIAHAFAGAGSSGAVVAPVIGGAVVVGLIAYDVKKRLRCNRIRETWVDTRADIYPKYTPYRDVCNDPSKRKRKVRGNVVKVLG